MKKKKWPKPNRIPRRVVVDERHYVKVMMVAPSEIGGCRGEWGTNEDEGDPCMGVIRISNEMTLASQWMVFREELQHALIDTQRFMLVDMPRIMKENGE